MNCDQCQQALNADHFCVIRKNAAGAPTLTVNVCSLLCLTRWAYAFGFVQGKRGIMAIHGMLDKISIAMRGNPAPLSPQPPKPKNRG